ncbi:hypothetical protein G7Y89_g3726 [Cudoniella acicularis]|uniref:Uncharacterized protein n=1 Tax=Cudoniella acicularis TaxID=354080 RepID=A0A8H4RSY6_9HELO|nr:hypothetical protein G7Y89_g3726 [Cudoniella acicularis]
MCLFTTRPKWEEEVVFANRPRHRHHSNRNSRTRISETVITKQVQRPSVEFVPAPLPSPSPRLLAPPSPKIIDATPLSAPTPPPGPTSRIELVSVEEDRISHASPRTSRVSVSHEKKSRRASSNRGAEEVYIERERIRERVPQEPQRDEYDTYRYIEAPESRGERRRSRSITYETNPRVSGRLVERERVVVEDGGRRREYYRRP